VFQVKVVTPDNTVTAKVSKTCPADCSQDRYTVAASYSKLSLSQKQNLQVRSEMDLPQ
jgi:hypothetical protein